MSSRLNRTIYVGNLLGDIRKREIEDLFHKYGLIVDVKLKIPARPPWFEDRRDAKDAVSGRDGYDFDGYRLRVELTHGGRHPSVDRYSSYNGSSSSRGSSRRSDYRVLVTGLPSSASWQDLKDHMRRAGDVCFSEVYPERHGEFLYLFDSRHSQVLARYELFRSCYAGVTGIVDYTNYDDMKYVIKKLDDSLFKNAFSQTYIRVREYESRQSYSKSPSRSPYSRSRSPGSDRSANKSPRGQRTRSASPMKSRSPSLSRSRSRSKSPAPHRYRRDRSRSISQEKIPSCSLARSD